MTSGLWYKCTVTNTDGSSSTTPVQVLSGLSGNDGDRLYLTNGAMAYSYFEQSNNGKEFVSFDVLGKFGGKWVSNTSFKGYWSMSTRTESSPSPVGYDYWKYDGPQLDSFKGAFNSSSSHVVSFSVDLAESVQSFAFGCDVMIRGNDDAPTTAVRNKANEDEILQLQLVDTNGLLEDADLTDAALVVNLNKRKGYTQASKWWIGEYSANTLYSFNRSASSTKLDSSGRVYEIQGDDSGCNVSYEGLEAGSTVKFGFSMGTVEEAGASLSTLTVVDDTSLTVPQTEPDVYYSIDAKGPDASPEPLWLLPVEGEENVYKVVPAGTPNAVQWVKSPTVTADDEQKLVIRGLAPGTDYVFKALDKSDYEAGTTEGAATVEITTKINPLTPAETGAAEPAISAHFSTITVAGVDKTKTYNLVESDGDYVLEEFIAPDENGKLEFSKLYPGEVYYLVCKDGVDDHKSMKVAIDTAEIVFTGTEVTDKWATAFKKFYVNHYPEVAVYLGKGTLCCPVAGCDDDAEHKLEVTVTADDAEYDGKTHGGETKLSRENSALLDYFECGSFYISLDEKGDVNGEPSSVPTNRGDYVYLRYFANGSGMYAVATPFSISDYVDVTFDTNGRGTAPDKVRQKAGAKVTAPEEPTADGYCFDGWFTDEMCTAAFDFDTAVTQDTVLYAKWVEAVTVTFDANGQGVAPDPIQLKSGTKAAAPEEPKADGYLFVGWCTDQACEKLFDFSSAISEDMTLYAKWAKEEVKTVTTPKPVLASVAKPSSKGKVAVSWNRVKGANGYVIYATYCGKKYKKVVKTTATSFNLKKLSGKKLDASKAVKVYVVAYGKADGKDAVLCKGAKMHVAPSGSKKYGNAKKVTVKSNAVTLKKGATSKVKAKVVMPKGKKQLGHCSPVRYVSSDKSVAKVSSKGVITAVKAGTCTVYAVAVNGKYAKVKVTVK